LPVLCYKIPKPHIRNNNLCNLYIGFMVHYFHFSFWNYTWRIWFTIHLDFNPLIMAIDEVITLILLLQKLQRIWCDNILLLNQLIRQMILKGFKICLLFHSTCFFFFSWGHCISIGIQGKPQQKKDYKIWPKFGFSKLIKLVLHIQCYTH